MWATENTSRIFWYCPQNIYIDIQYIYFMKGRSELIQGTFEQQALGRVKFSNLKCRPLSLQALHITHYKMPFLALLHDFPKCAHN